MSQPSVLVVDDDVAVATVVIAILEQAGIDAHSAENGEAAIEALERYPFDVVLTDLRMPGIDGLQLLETVSKRWPDVAVVIVTAHGTVPLAVEAMKSGAADFVMKPFDREEIVFVVQKAAARSHVPAAAPEPASMVGSIIGDAPSMAEIHDLIRRAAPRTSTVLIRGESGTGKELVARLLHDLSPRRGGPFVKIHCAALPDTLLESELFGYEKGAFTGASHRKPGRVELANGGTLFLDEIGDITKSMQVKLLRLLQDHEFERLGSTRTEKADVRFIAATHRNLDAMIQTGDFREDLFYRLNVVPLFVPPLRQRPGDVERLSVHFFERFCAAHDRANLALDAAAVAVLATLDWPGNVRQLQNFMERLVVLSDAPRIGVNDVQREANRALGDERTEIPAARNDDPGTLQKTRSAAEKAALEQALARAGGNRTLAARLLGVSRRTLYNKLSDHGLM